MVNKPTGKVLVFDTETSGLPPYAWNDKIKKRDIVSPTHVKSWKDCRIVQIAWAIYEHDGTLVNKTCHLIKPNGFIVSPSSTAIHGITHIEAMKEGESIDRVLENFIKDINNCELIVAHNISFDTNVVQAELHRLNKVNEAQCLANKQGICTMKLGTRPGEKWPKLVELYERCFNERPLLSHKADADVELCARIYFHLLG